MLRAQEPDQASCTRRLPADRRCGATSALARSRPTSGKSPVRESRTPGSVRGAGRNPCPYRDSREIVVIPGADAVHLSEGKMDGRANASARPTRRGLRPWHVWTLLAREPGDLWIGHRSYGPGGPWREGEEPYRRWQKRDLSARHYVYVWADGVYLQARMEPQAECMLVLMGATAEGKKELIGFQTGMRESGQSWKEPRAS